jgi:hypothetical protein
MGVILCGIFLIGMSALTHSVFLIIVAVVIAVLAVGITGLVQSALARIHAAALYRYAITGEGTLGFDSNAMKLAFAPKQRPALLRLPAP